MAEHVHVWKPVMHLDGCHWYEWNVACECGAARRERYERDVSFDSYSAVWMDDEDGEWCLRCEELLAGAKVAAPLIVESGPGTDAPATREEADRDARESFLRDVNHPNYPADEAGPQSDSRDDGD